MLWRKLNEGSREKEREEGLMILNQVRNDFLEVTFQQKTQDRGGKPHGYLGENHSEKTKQV